MNEKIQLKSNRGPNPDPQITTSILDFLKKEGICYLKEIARGTDSDKVTVLKHLEKLKKRNVVGEEKKGNMRLFWFLENQNQAEKVGGAENDRCTQ